MQSTILGTANYLFEDLFTPLKTNSSGVVMPNQQRRPMSITAPLVTSITD